MMIEDLDILREPDGIWSWTLTIGGLNVQGRVHDNKICHKVSDGRVLSPIPVSPLLDLDVWGIVAVKEWLQVKYDKYEFCLFEEMV